jgi:hypothetical protein
MTCSPDRRQISSNVIQEIFLIRYPEMRSLPCTDGDDSGGVNIQETLRISYPEMRSLPCTIAMTAVV